MKRPRCSLLSLLYFILGLTLLCQRGVVQLILCFLRHDCVFIEKLIELDGLWDIEEGVEGRGLHLKDVIDARLGAECAVGVVQDEDYVASRLRVVGSSSKG